MNEKGEMVPHWKLWGMTPEIFSDVGTKVGDAQGAFTRSEFRIKESGALKCRKYALALTYCQDFFMNFTSEAFQTLRLETIFRNNRGFGEDIPGRLKTNEF